jgi:hypothetical protein
MGEGESFAGLLEFRASEVSEESTAQPSAGITAPSPIGWERARVRVDLLLVFIVFLSLL